MTEIHLDVAGEERLHRALRRCWHPVCAVADLGEKPIPVTVKQRPERPDDLLKFLDDRILFPEPLDAVVSFGDLVVTVGICELAYFASRRRRRRASRQSSPASSPRRVSTRSSAPSTRPS